MCYINVCFFFVTSFAMLKISFAPHYISTRRPVVPLGSGSFANHPVKTVPLIFASQPSVPFGKQRARHNSRAERKIEKERKKNTRHSECPGGKCEDIGIKRTNKTNKKKQDSQISNIHLLGTKLSNL